jgi:ribosomal protein S12 methylthiotransferase accessory factor YcaO
VMWSVERHRESLPRHIRTWMNDVVRKDERYLLPSAPFKSSHEYQQPSVANLQWQLEYCVAQLEKRGLEAVAVDLTRTEIDFPVARIVVPGMRHFWPRFAPGRLYEAPITLGWLHQRLTEEELNPIPCWL